MSNLKKISSVTTSPPLGEFFEMTCLLAYQKSPEGLLKFQNR